MQRRNGGRESTVGNGRNWVGGGGDTELPGRTENYGEESTVGETSRCGREALWERELWEMTGNCQREGIMLENRNLSEKKNLGSGGMQ